ncbi:hypothetical protein [Mycolicibacterium sp.]|uniref:hypothetical protein n=1 Tax=Mycolicibacterium sp. TaxID=2320850 RepID=UPI003D0B3002
MLSTISMMTAAAALREDGYTVRAIANPVARLDDRCRRGDGTAFVRAVDGPVVLVGLSYGGTDLYLRQDVLRATLRQRPTQ